MDEKMNWKPDKAYRGIGFTAFLVVAASMLFYFLLFRTGTLGSGIAKLISIFNPIIYGFIIAYILNPQMQVIENLIYRLIRRMKLHPGSKVNRLIHACCSVAALVLDIIVIYAIISLVLPETIRSIRNIIVNFQTYVDNINNFIDTKLFSNNQELDEKTTSLVTEYAGQIQNWFQSEITPLLNSLANGVTGYLMTFVNFMKNLFLGVIISLYILISNNTLHARFHRIIYSVFSVPTGNRILVNLRFVDEKFGGFLIGKLIDSLIIGVMCYIINLILGMPYAILVAVVIGVTNIIPFFGPFIGAIPCAVLIFVVDPLKALIFIAVILVLQQFDGNFLGPKILGNSVGVSSFMVVLAILLGSGFFGVTGMIIGVPLCAVITAIIQSWILRRMKKKELPGDLESYHNLDKINPQTKEFIRKKAPAGDRSLYDKISWRSEDVSRFDEPIVERSWERTMEQIEREDAEINGTAYPEDTAGEQETEQSFGQEKSAE